MRRTYSSLLAFILFSSVLSGCTGVNESTEELHDSKTTDDEIPNPDAYECFEFEGWIVLAGICS